MVRWLERSRGVLEVEAGRRKRRLWVFVAGAASVFGLLFLLGGWPLADGPATPLVSLGDVLVRLGIVLAAAYASLYALRAHVGGRGAQAAAQERIRILQRCRLGPQQTLYLVAVADRALLLGATAANIATLAELGPAERLEQAAQAGQLPFAEHLRAFGLGAPRVEGGIAADGR